MGCWNGGGGWARPLTEKGGQSRARRWVRPWALGGSILLLLLCLPMLHPLRYPAEPAPEQRALLSMIHQNTEGRLARVDTPPLSLRALNEPSPTFALVLTPPAYLLKRWGGLNFDDGATTMAYLLIALGVTLPAALSAGMIYRMARLFELSRPHRAALGLLCVAGSGLVGYATTLNAHALSAALLIGAATATLHALRCPVAWRGAAWAPVSGACVVLAASLDVAVVPAALLMPLVFLAWRVAWSMRLAAFALFLVGAAPPAALHEALHAGSLAAPLSELAAQPPIYRMDDRSDDPESGWAPWAAYHLDRVARITFGDHGVFSHYPVLLFGAVGTFMLMHRHWPEAVKWLAAGTMLAAVLAVAAVALSRADLFDAGYATRWFVAFSPLLLFWAGAWLRKPHGRATWAIAAALAAFSVATGMIGAARPMPPDGYSGYTAASALRLLTTPPTNIADGR